MFEAIGKFFGRIGSWIRGLFGSDEDPTPINEPVASVEVGPLEQIGIVEDEPVVPVEPQVAEPEPQLEPEPETAEAEPVAPETAEEAPSMNSTAANDATEDGIIEAYFAKKTVVKAQTEEAGNSYPYKFNGEHTVTTSNRNGIAQDMVDVSKSALEARDEYLTVPMVLTALQNITYLAQGVQDIPTKKLKDQIKFEKIDSSALESDIYVFAKTGNLDGKEITILIREKEELLVATNASLPVLKRDEAVEDQKSEDLEEITELKATIDEGMVAIPIRLLPKSDDDLKIWQDKIAKGKEDGTYPYTFNNAAGTTITAENKKELAGIIAKNANEGKVENTKVEEGKKAYADDVETVLAVQTYNKGQQITFPIFKKVIEKLWLKTSAQGDEELHEKEFLNESDQENTSEDADSGETVKDNYFVIGGICECEAKVRAFMRMIRIGEGTQDEGGYSRIVGGSTFSDHGKDFSDHPKVYIAAHDSTAAGAYQITKTNWNDTPFANWRTSHNRSDFSKISQDVYCVYLIKEKRGALTEIIDDNIEAGIEKCSPEWASLPGAGYGQREEKIADILKKYEEFLLEELSGNTTLHLEAGFLKDIFAVSCCNDDSNDVTLHYIGETADDTALSTITTNILKEVGKASNNMDIYITSTARSPHDQARIMYENISATSAATQKGIYANPGDQVIDVYTVGQNAGNDREQIISDMEAKINELGPSTVSRHIVADSSVLNTLDVSIRRLSNPNDFRTEMNKRSELDVLLTENGAYHIQINQ